MTKAPLHEATYLILTALVEAPRHGYAVLEEVRRISDGRVDLRAGTLYAALDRLRTEGLVDIEREEQVQSRLRRYYRLTASGAQRLAEESARLRSNAEAASVRLRRAGFILDGGAA
ncbi:PadR family transcriptional regulator [Micromonospora chokoriensis]|uniref:Transcriptional regulator, PadR family n=1 Tax=Micromonospora chokoriensis TaxID=356851 RepID=A0A1C4VJY9_9ACTN|nr:PadR family transcriptional regulator [Micromonospora chokoriensis]SCE84258.1 transcriptional regulator, PadR family [Micromonospora chokoriensis]